MPLLPRNTYPPHGFMYREPKTAWMPRDPNQEFGEIARQISEHRKQNPRLFTAEEASIIQCRIDLDLYTCHRLNNDPKWCGNPEQASHDNESNEKATKRKHTEGKGCASCGRRRKAG